MNWRRGLLFAGIHLAIAIAMLTWDEAANWRSFTAQSTLQLPHYQLAAWQEVQSIDVFNPCIGKGISDGPPSMPALLVSYANLPVGLITGGHEACKSQSQLDRFVQMRLGRGSRASELVICAIFCILILIEWLLVGSGPFVHPRRWWLEPGAFITACAAAGAWLVITTWGILPYQLEVIYWIPIFAAFLMWLVWFGLLVSKLIRFGWSLLRRRPEASTA